MNLFKKSARKIALSLILTLCLLLQACSLSGEGGNFPGEFGGNVSDEFNRFTDTLFRESISSDALSLTYTLSHPEKYGVSTAAGGFKAVSYEEMCAAAPETENLLSALGEYDRDKLSTPEQILYDSLDYTLRMDLKGADFILFSRPLSPVTGLQAQLPVLLAEYTFDSVQDVENYLALLASIPDYYTSILTFMELQAKEGMLPCRSTLEQIAEQCLTFLEDDGEKILLSSFKKRIQACDFLDQDAMLAYRKQNKKLVRTCIVPAYEQLIDGLNVLALRCNDNGSLSSYKNGKEYYRYLFACESGSDTDVEKYFTELKTRMEKSRETLLSYAKKDPALFGKLDTRAAAKSTPEEQLQMLSSAIAADFPETQKVNFKVSYVDESLEDYLSPAFYLTPPLDAFTENVIYINNSSRFTGSDLSTTLAHEGYPGHLYQNVYFRQLNRPLLSYVLNFSGYTEGWASYAETYSYKYFGYTKDEVGILRNNMIISLCLYGLCDIGVHYYGWSEEKLSEFLNENGTVPADTVRSLYTNIIDEPGSYLKYSIGFVEFLKLKEAVRKRMGDAYSEKAFHKFVLTVGPAPFSVLYRHMDSFLYEG